MIFQIFFYRFGVVRGFGSKMVKDCYIIALPKTESIHPILMPLDGPGLDEDRDDLLLALIVRSKRKRSSDGTPIYQSVAPSSKISKRTTSSEVSSAANVPATSQDVPTYNPTPVDKLYDPADDINDQEEVYDPERAFVPDKSSKNKRSRFVDENEPTFSSDESPSPPPPKKSFTEDKGGASKATEKKKEAPKVTEQKPETMAGFKGLPTGIANILFGGAPTSSAPTSTTSASEKAAPETTSRRDPRKKPTSTTTASATSTSSASDPPPKMSSSKSSSTSSTSVLGSMSDADLLAMIPDSEKSADTKKGKESTKKSSKNNKPTSSTSSTFKPSKSSSRSPPTSTFDSGNGNQQVPPPAPSIRPDLSQPPPPIPNSNKGPWMQGMEPQTQQQPTLPWPTANPSASSRSSKSSEKEYHRRSSRDDYYERDRYRDGRDHRDRDRGGRDYRDRGDYDRKRDDRYRRSSRDDYYDRRDRDRSDRDRDRRYDRDYDRDRSRDHDRDYDRGDHRGSRSSRDHQENYNKPEENRHEESTKKVEEEPSKPNVSTTNLAEQEIKSTNEQPAPSSNTADSSETSKNDGFLPFFSVGEPKPPGDDDVVPF